MSRYQANDFGYEFPTFPTTSANETTTSSNIDTNEALEQGERQPLVKSSSNNDNQQAHETALNTLTSVAKTTTKAAVAAATSNTNPIINNGYELYQDQPTPTSESESDPTTYRYQPAKHNRGGESYFFDSEKDGVGTSSSSSVSPMACLGSFCCCLTFGLIVSGGILSFVSQPQNKDIETRGLIGAFFLITGIGTCLCGCMALCIGSCIGGSGRGSMRKGGGGDGDDEKEVKVRFRRLNDRFQKGCMDGEKGLDRVRLDVVGHMKEFKEAVTNETKKKKETEKQNRIELEKRVKKDLASGISTRTIRQIYRPVTFYFTFDGDTNVSTLELLRKQVSLVVNLARPHHDRCCVSITSPGGSVARYGLAASQLVRIRKAGVHLTVCVDEIAASGGYMMASVADVICAAPFAIVGSLGVVSYAANFQRLLDKHSVDAYLTTAGRHKRTIDAIGVVTEEHQAKLKEELEDVHVAFQDHVAIARPQLRERMEEVATGEHWLAVQAKEKGLVDVILTSDEYLESICEEFDVVEVLEKKEKERPSVVDFLGEPFGGIMKSVVGSVLDRLRSAVEGRQVGGTGPEQHSLPMAVV